jgi:hypothetical protein
MRLMIAAVLLLAGCSGEPPTIDNTDVEQLQDELGAINECTAEWDAYVDEWNALTVARDEAGDDNVVVDGVAYEDYESYATAKGYPLSFEEHCPES